MSRATHSIICACHAVYTGARAADVRLDSSWVLQPFQQGEPPSYIEHLRTAVELTAQDPAALLLLSGGATRGEAGSKSEAQGYFEVAEHLGWFNHPAVRRKILLEEYSRDSFENLLFSICRFKQATGAYPDRVTAISWEFKRERFEFHRATLGLLPDGFVFSGVHNPVDLAAALAGEQQALAEFQSDPPGLGLVLSAKRNLRNPFGNQHNFHSACPEFSRFLGTIRLHTSSAADMEPRRS